MRLLDTSEVTLHEFDSHRAPVYAIVSHRWTDEEVTYQNFLSGTNRGGRGWQKIIQGCRIARLRNIKWLWIDTCCLDKHSSAELTESVNAMFNYYKVAKQCYAFLPDVEVQHSDPAFYDQLQNSIWFTRGWTLQELLASTLVNFYNAGFQLIGVKTRESSFCEALSKITGIGITYLQRPRELRLASIAERMRWASLRETTRVEDMAYCLLGIFDVNMPLIYGEGRKAFTRLQLEIISKSEDESIFAWTSDKPLWKGLLAPSPYAFAGHEAIEQRDIFQRAPFSMTNKGLQLSLPVRTDSIGRKGTTLLFPLNCVRISTCNGSVRPREEQIALRIYVKALPDIHNSGLRVFIGDAVREPFDLDQLLYSEMIHRKFIVGRRKSGRAYYKLRRAAEWNHDLYGCSSTVGVFERADAAEGHTHAIYFKQGGM
ncbi:hypothetical protein AC579_3584 [Pseudocercospora musae]|uniref:Heterokaryon incompatibility domain-containing protein n=1 Tax=Pseudocercospora musae TaxID=113226 RepID=A0A139IW12_9PEZI|nr:hypothetical protein AC579_3584 [Pseudocercospora musae]